MSKLLTPARPPALSVETLVSHKLRGSPRFGAVVEHYAPTPRSTTPAILTGFIPPTGRLPTPSPRALARTRLTYAKVAETPHGKDAIRRGLMLSFSPTNLDVYSLAYTGAFDGFSGGRVVSGSAFTVQALAAGIWAQTFDTIWADSATLDEVEAMAIYGQSYAVWDGRNPTTITTALATPTIDAIIAAIDDAEAYLASEGITPPGWNTGGSSGGGIVGPTGPVQSGVITIPTTNASIAVDIGTINATLNLDQNGAPTDRLTFAFWLVGESFTNTFIASTSTYEITALANQSAAQGQLKVFSSGQSVSFTFIAAKGKWYAG